MLTLSGAGAFTRGTITEGTNPLDQSSLDGTPSDNITPAKLLAAARFAHASGRWWAEYGVRAQTDVKRVAETLLDSPFLIAQDLLSLDGFTVHRIAWGLNLSRGRDRVGLTFAVENLTDRVLSRALPVRAGAGPQLYRWTERGSVLGRRLDTDLTQMTEGPRTPQTTRASESRARGQNAGARAILNLLQSASNLRLTTAA